MSTIVRPVEGAEIQGAGLEFLSGGGELGELIRSHDWTRTPLGPPASWPQSLKTAVRILLTSRQPFWLGWGPDLTYLYNDPYKSIIGGKHPHALGQPFRVVWKEIWDVVGPMADVVVNRNEGTYVEAQLLIMERHGYAEETYYTFSYSPVPNDEGGPGGLICANTDDTRRVIGERQLATLRDLAALVANARSRHDACELSVQALRTNDKDLPFALIFLEGAKGETTCAHTAGAEALADAALWPSTEAIRSGRSLVVEIPASESVPQGFWPRPPTHAAIVPISGSSRDNAAGMLVAGLSPFRRADESYLDFLNLVAGQIGAAIGTAEAYEAERRRAEVLAELDRAKTVFFSNVSHEFRTPLTLMLGPLEELLQKPEAIAVAGGELHLVHRNALRLLKLVNSLLDFSRIEAGRAQASYEPTDIASFTRDLASTFGSAMQKAGLRYCVHCEPTSEPVYVDRDMWEKVVLNLLSNAFKFTLEGGVSVRLREKDKTVTLEVSDTGVGIAQSELPRLFERFHRIENSRARTHEGTGIGLALVQELVNLHGGLIEVASEPGKGTTFSIRLPMGTAHLPEGRIRAARTAVSTATRAEAFVQEALRWLPNEDDSAFTLTTVLTEADLSRGPHAGATRGARVLLADDNADMRDYVRRLLDPHYDVATVANGAEALTYVRDERPDLVISDVMMPELDGFGLVKAIRHDPDLSTTPVILLSARAGEEASIEGRESGADDYVVKPFSSRELLARVAGALALARTREEASEKLRESDERFRAVQEASPDGFTVLEAVRDEKGAIVDFRWVYLNEAAARIAGGPRDSFLGKRLLDVHPGNRPAGLFDIYVRVTETGAPWIGELRYEHDRLDALVRLAVARVGDGVAISSVDISERYRAEEALKAADRQKDEFLAMLAHELRNPLAPIRNAGELLSRMVVADPKAHAVIEIVRRQVSHLSRLVDDLLDVSRITQKRIDLKKETLDISEIVHQALETVEPAIRDRRHDLTITSSFRPLYVHGDMARLVQSLVNLLTNAIKYTDVGGKIHVTSREERGEAVIEVEDNGAGIPASLLPRIFDLFVQSDRTLDRSQGGLGVGLSVVRRLIEMHGGRVSASSHGPGRGSIFTVRLPLAEPHEAAAPKAAARQPVRARRILVVDDNADAANTLSMMLRLDGHDAVAVYSAQDALDRVRSFQPELVLLDIGLPHMDGYQVAREIRRIVGPGQVQLAAITGYGQPEDRTRAMESGFDIHLVKPITPEELHRMLTSTQTSS